LRRRCWWLSAGWIELKPDALLEQVRFVVLSCARTPDAAKRVAMGAFKASNPVTLRTLQAPADLQKAGGPFFQASGFLELAPSAHPAELRGVLATLRQALRKWTAYSGDVVGREPRLRLLGARSRLAAMLACKHWMQGQTHPAGRVAGSAAGVVSPASPVRLAAHCSFP